MAQGSIRIRCAVCRKAGLDEKLCKSHPERTYQALFPIPGTTKQDVATYQQHTDPKKPTALEQAKLFLAEKKILYSKNPEFKKPGKETFEEIALSYLADKKASPLIGPASYSNYTTIIKTHLLPMLGSHQISKITPKLAEQVRQSVQGNSRSIQQKVNRHLNAIFRRASRESLIEKNPTTDLDKLGAMDDINYNILEPEQVRSFLDHPALTHFFKIYYMLPIYLGLRAAEVAGLGWDCVNFDKKYVDIKRTILKLTAKEANRAEEIGLVKLKIEKLVNIGTSFWAFKSCPKTKAGFRRIPLNDDLVKELQIFKIEQPDNPYNLVLFDHYEKTPININSLNQDPMKKHIKAAEIPTVKYHELRHTFCSLAFAAGMDLGLVQYYMGHKEPGMTLGIYNHVMEEKKRQGSGFAQKMAQMINPSSRVHVNGLSMESI